jgi:Type I phosphodiesterase / nucleotide pyrophosphatase
MDAERKMHRRAVLAALAVILAVILARPFFAQENAGRSSPHRNAVIFIADGLRNGSVNETDAPTLSMIRKQGVYFSNSHSLFPTFTTANASAIATGHGLGDTGDFSNVIWIGYPVFETGNFGLPPGTPTPFLENDQILSDVAAHYNGNYLGETTLLTAALDNGYNAAAIGKLGPTAIQELESTASVDQHFPVNNRAIILDDSTGSGAGIPLPPEIAKGLSDAGLSLDAPARTNGYGPSSKWNNGVSGTLHPNVVQQQWFADAATRVILPAFAKDSSKPFVLLFWSRDPDGTQHNQGDSPGELYPGINGESSRLAVHNADDNLRQLIAWLDANPTIKANTDVFVTSDHGFATISRREIGRTGRLTASEAARHYYLDANGNAEFAVGTLPSGFLAIDLALAMHTNLFDPDRRTAEGIPGPYRQVKLSPELFEHPSNGNGLLGDAIYKADGSDAKAIVAANGGSDLIYVPDKNPDTVKQIVGLLATFDYVGGIFVDDQYGQIPGALPMSDIGLVGSSALPRPAIAVAFKVFYLSPGNLQTAVQISDTTLQEGQGMHGGFGRECTFNNMAAMGPDFKSGLNDEAPVSNADIAPTLAHSLGLQIASHGKLQGRVITEALKGGPDKVSSAANHAESSRVNGLRTILEYQQLGDERYYDRACFADASAAGCQ